MTLLLLLAACSTPEDAAELEALGAPVVEDEWNEAWTDFHDCNDLNAGDIQFWDEGAESGWVKTFFDRHGEPVRSQSKVRFTGTFTRVPSGYQLSYQGAYTVFEDFAKGTLTWTGVEWKIKNQDGKVVARNIGNWVWDSEWELVKGGGHQDFTWRICDYFPPE